MSDAPAPAIDAHALPPGARPIPLRWAVVPLFALIGCLAGVIVVLPQLEPGFSGSGHIPLVIAAAVAALVARRHGFRWHDLEHGIVTTIGLAMSAILVLIVIGALIGTWLIGGIVPALIHWGLELMHPSYFLPATCVVCSIVSLVSGSSWSTAATVGLAAMGVGQALGVNPAITAGAVISGSYFGDKLSPMSDTTNLAPAMAGTDLFAHVRHMLYTTVPPWLVALVIYAVIGANLDTVGAARFAGIQPKLVELFDPGVIHLWPPLVVIVLVVLRKPALPGLLLGALLGGVVAVVHGGASLGAVLEAALNGYKADTGVAAIDELLSRGGMMSMANTVFLILSAMAFGGVMERTGMLRTLTLVLLRAVHSTGSLVAATIGTSVGINVLAADQYLAIVVPGRMYAHAYRERGLDPKNLSRALEDGGTLTSALVPWNTCGAFMSATLGVATFAYAPYAFLNLLTPLLSILYGYTGWTITRVEARSAPETPTAAS